MNMQKKLANGIAYSIALILITASTAQAGGFFALPRGVRGVAQGGALVAGSDSPDALWYNPAGLTQAGNQLLLDFVLPIQGVDFERVNAGGVGMDDPYNNPFRDDVIEPTVRGTSATLPIPGLAYTFDLGLRDWNFGMAMMAPSATLMKWPATIVEPDTGTTLSAPQRYSILSMEGSAMAKLILGGGYQATDNLSLGASLGVLTGRFQVQSAMSIHEAGFGLGAPESEATDAIANVVVPFFISPSMSLGLVYRMGDFRVGLSAETATTLSGQAKVQVDLEQSREAYGGLVGNVEVNGEDAQFEAPFPWIVRGGLEYKPTDAVRIELSLTVEGWSRQSKITATPENVSIDELPFLGWDGEGYALAPIEMERNMRDVYALGLGTEWDVTPTLSLRTALMFETGAFDDAYMNVMTPDTDKVLLSVGGGYQIDESVLAELTVGYLVMRDREVNTSKVYRPQAIRPAQPEPSDGAYELGDPVPLGNGRYGFQGATIALGLRWM